MALVRCLFALFILCLAPWLHAQDASAVFSRFKSASGGERWDTVQTTESKGILSVGGLSGEIRITQHLPTGRSRTDYKLGPVEGADGYDGRTGWSQAPGGEIAILDAPDAVRRSRSQAWLDSRAFWYPARMAATHGPVTSSNIQGKRYHVIETTPAEGDPITLWFSADSNLLARTIQKQGADTLTTTFEDYRDVGGLKVPFLLITEMTDSAGRPEPRNRSEVRLTAVSTHVSFADTHFAAPEMKATARIDSPGGVTHIPFDLINNHIYVDGSIDGKKARFLVDTGGVNLLTPEAAKKLGVATAGTFAASGVGEERVDASYARADNIRIGAATLLKPVIYVIDLGELDSIEGVPFDGLVGYEMFRRFGVQIDYARRVITLMEPQKLVAPAGATAVSFELSDRIPIVTGKLDGIDARFSIDTGSRASLSVHSPFARQHKLVERYGAAPECVVGWGAGGASRGRIARLGTLQLGDVTMPGIVGALSTTDKGAFANPDLSANLGGEILRRFTVTFDYAARRMYLQPNASFGEPHHFDRSGLFLSSEGDRLKVLDVASGSAAERAGVRTNDHILTISGKPVSSQPLHEWRRHLRESHAGARVAMRLSRDNAMKEVVLTLADRVPAPGAR